MGKGYIPAGSPDISAAGLPGTGPAGSRYLEGEKKMSAPFIQHCAVHFSQISTNRIGMMGNSDSNGPGMSTGRGNLRNVCIGSWTLYDLSSQSEHFVTPKGW